MTAYLMLIFGIRTLCLSISLYFRFPYSIIWSFFDGVPVQKKWWINNNNHGGAWVCDLNNFANLEATPSKNNFALSARRCHSKKDRFKFLLQKENVDSVFIKKLQATAILQSPAKVSTLLI